MDYERKKRWVSYHHIKCKMYLRNDFRFECAYCRMREQDTGVWGEASFEKDHFTAKASGTESDLDAYDNMIYACKKCNGTKSDQPAELLLDPCRDNIYTGSDPHVKCLGREGQYQLQGNTEKGKQYIDILQLNASFYLEMRERQEQADKDNRELETLLDEISKMTDLPEALLEKLREHARKYYMVQINPQDPAFRCGCSRAGLAFRKVLDILKNASVPCELLFAENDFDIKIQYQGKEYLCEVVLNDSAEAQVRNIRVKKEQRESWLSEEGEHGILYYYLKTESLEFYRVSEETELLGCFRQQNLDQNS